MAEISFPNKCMLSIGNFTNTKKKELSFLVYDIIFRFLYQHETDVDAYCRVSQPLVMFSLLMIFRKKYDTSTEFT